MISTAVAKNSRKKQDTLVIESAYQFEVGYTPALLVRGAYRIRCEQSSGVESSDMAAAFYDINGVNVIHVDQSSSCDSTLKLSEKETLEIEKISNECKARMDVKLTGSFFHGSRAMSPTPMLRQA